MTSIFVELALGEVPKYSENSNLFPPNPEVLKASTSKPGSPGASATPGLCRSGSFVGATLGGLSKSG